MEIKFDEWMNEWNSLVLTKTIQLLLSSAWLTKQENLHTTWIFLDFIQTIIIAKQLHIFVCTYQTTRPD